MRRPASTLVVALLVVGAMIAVPAVSATHTVGAQESTPGDERVDGNQSIAPGERFSGVVGVQKAEIDGDVESRAFGIQVAEAESDDAKAAVVAQRHQQNEQRLAELQERLNDLEQARENGSISYGEYAARTAAVHSELRNVERSANETAEVAKGIPDETLAANGVDREAIDTLRKNASEMGGQEVAALARSIAGPSVDRGPPEHTDAPDRGNQTAESDRGADDRGPGGNGADDAGSTDDETAGTADDNATETDSGSDATGGEQAPTEDESTGDGGAGGY